MLFRHLYVDYGRGSLDKNNIVRKEMGLEWMLRPKDNIERETATATTSDQLEDPQVEEVCRRPSPLAHTNFSLRNLNSAVRIVRP